MFIKKINIVLIFLIVAFSLYSEEKDSTLKVISYNIWNGYEWGKDSLRHQEVLSWISSQNPDVVAMQELNDYTKEKLLIDAKAWGHSYAEILKTSGYPVGITSNKPIITKERIIENMHHGALYCETWGIDFIVIHLSPFSYQKRHEEANLILSKLSEIKNEQNKYIILGDFNAVSPFDADFYNGNEEMMTGMRNYEAKNDHVRNLFFDELEYGVLSAFLSFPLIDVVQRYTYDLDERISCPTQVNEKQKNEGRPSDSNRIDYILVSPILANICTNAKVLNGKPTFYLSDHYPVMAEFKFE